MFATEQLHLHITNSMGHFWASNTAPFCGDYFSFDRWRPGMLIVEPLAVYLPLTMPTGNYTISIELSDRQTDALFQARDPNGKLVGSEIETSTLQVEKSQNNFTASDLQKQFQLENPLSIDMAEMRLIGYKTLPDSIQAGQVLEAGVYWRARVKPSGDYRVRVQLRKSNGQVVLEQIARPANNSYPTTQWNEGEVLLDWHDINLPTTMLPADYELWVSLDDSATGKIMGETMLKRIQILEP